MKIKSTLEQIISNDLAAIWTVLTPDEKRRVADHFIIHDFKKNQLIYAEGDTPQHLWCLLQGKVKLFKDGIGGRPQILRLYRPISATALRLPANNMCRARRPLRLRAWAPSPWTLSRN